MARLLDRASAEFEHTAELAQAHADRRSPYVDDATRERELARARHARELVRRARANAARVRAPGASR